MISALYRHCLECMDDSCGLLVLLLSFKSELHLKVENSNFDLSSDFQQRVCVILAGTPHLWFHSDVVFSSFFFPFHVETKPRNIFTKQIFKKWFSESQTCKHLKISEISTFEINCKHIESSKYDFQKINDLPRKMWWDGRVVPEHR